MTPWLTQVYFFIDCLVESSVCILVVSLMAVWLTQVEFLKDSLVDFLVDTLVDGLRLSG